MALTLAGVKGTDWQRGDMFYVDPSKIVVRNDLRGRHFPPTDADIIRRAVSFYRYGQIQPCEVRLVVQGSVKNVPVLNSGFTRTAAARLLREGFQVPANFDEETVPKGLESHVAPVKAGDFIKVEDFKLQVRHIKCNEKEALVRNIIENNERNATSDVDDAHNQERLRRDCGFTNADIARLYGYGNGGQNRVSRLSRLLELPDELQSRIHFGEVPTQAALDLLDSGRPVEEWNELLEAATNAKGKVVATQLANVVRDKHLSDFDNADEQNAAVEKGTHPVIESDNSSKPVKVKSRTTANLRKIVDSVCNHQWDNVDPATVKLFQKIKLWLAGRCKDETLLDAFQTHLESNPTDENEKAAA